jgi:hypothetical protein
MENATCIDPADEPTNNGHMEANEITVPHEVLADAQSIIGHFASGKPLDPDAVRRVRECSERIREDTFRRFGLVDVGVPAIRELRDGE